MNQELRLTARREGLAMVPGVSHRQPFPAKCMVMEQLRGQARKTSEQVRVSISEDWGTGMPAV